MKLITMSLFASLIFTTTVYSQTEDKALAKVKYNFVHIRDTADRDKPYTENMILLIGKNMSRYVSYDKIQQTITRRKQLEEQIKNSAGSQQVINVDARGSKPVSANEYFFFPVDHKLISKEGIGMNSYLLEEPDANIDWKISKDTLSLSGVHCQKATTKFRGRNWTAWFAPELPFQSGPWKLNGLPGLIVEAYDDKKEVQFLFAGIEKLKQTNQAGSAPADTKIIGLDAESEELLKLPNDAIKTTAKDASKLKKAMADDPEGFLNSQLAVKGFANGASAGNITIKRQGSSAKRPAINNPIELTDKK